MGPRRITEADVQWAQMAQDAGMYSHYSPSPGQPCSRCGQLPKDSTVSGQWSRTIGAPMCPIAEDFLSRRHHPSLYDQERD